MSLLADTLVFAMPPVGGGLVAGVNGALQGSFGGDRGFVKSITVDNVTYTFDPVANGGLGGITTSGAGIPSFTYDGTTRTLTVDTDTTSATGGEFSAVMTTGGFTFQPTSGFTSESVSYVLADRDGDTASNTVTLSAGVGADHAPIVRDDLVITNISDASAAIAIPSWALLYNDTDADGNVITVTATSGASSGSVSPLSGSPIATVTFADTGNSNGGGFTYAGSTASPQASDIGSVTVVRNQSGSTLTGTGFGDILIGRNGSNDIIANEGNDVLIGGTGADRLTGGAGTDIFGFAAGDSVLTIGGSGTGGTVSGYDVITDFALGNIARLSEMLHFDGAAVVANSVTNGINSALQLHTGSVVASHRITNGMVTFDDADTFAGAVSLATTGDIAAVAQYLTGQDLGDAGATVAFTATLSGVTHTYVFLQGTGAGTSGNASSDILIQVQSVAADSLSASGGQLSLLDTVPPLIAPAGIAGELINLALTGPSADHVGAVTLTITGVPAGWALSEGSSNGDGSWMVQTSDIAALSIISPDDYTGALALDVTVSWTNPDGSTGSETIPDNIEVYAKGVPIFALSGDDFLTASSGSDLLVFSQPIGHDTVYSFDVAEDQIDLIGYAGLTSFAEVLIQLTEDASGNAVHRFGGRTVYRSAGCSRCGADGE